MENGIEPALITRGLIGIGYYLEDKGHDRDHQDGYVSHDDGRCETEVLAPVVRNTDEETKNRLSLVYNRF